MAVIVRGRFVSGVLPLILGILSGVALPPASPGPARATPAGAPLVTHLTVDQLPAPMEVDPAQAPLLGWQLGGGRQTAYQVQVRTSPGTSAPSGPQAAPDVWDSGPVAGPSSTAVPYGGPPLAGSEDYRWRVRVRDAAGRWSAWSAPGHFGTAPAGTWADAVPVWAAPGSPGPWTDYTLEATLVVRAVAAGVTFRATDTANLYLWQFRASTASTPNSLVVHKEVGGSFTVLKTVPLPFPLLPDTGYDVRIAVTGATVTTSLRPTGTPDWTDVDTTTDATHRSGGIGFRTGNSEQATFDAVRVTDPTGATLYADDFDRPADPDFACGTVTGSALFVDKGKNCATGLRSAAWAFLRGTASLRTGPGRALAWAHLYLTAASTAPARQFVAKVWVNGTFVGIGPTRPVGTETRFDGYDVTPLLAGGGTAVIAAQAWTTSDQRFLAHLVARYTDGTTETSGTGRSWRGITGSDAVPDGGSIGTSYYTAPVENLRAAAYPLGFETPGFDDSGWPAAVEKEAFARLTPTPTGKVRRELELPSSVVEYSPGNYLVDYGRTWIGGLSLDVEGTAGQVLDLRFGQVTSGPDTVRYQTSAGNTYRDRWVLVAGRQHLETWGLRVFRYVNVLGAPSGLTAADLPAVAYVHPLGDRLGDPPGPGPAAGPGGADPGGAGQGGAGAGEGTFSSSDAALDRIWRLSRDTVESTGLNLYVDSWERERGEYEADDHLQLLANLFTGGDAALGAYSTQYLVANRTWPTEWPMYVVLAMHDAYLHTADLRPLRRDYAQLQAKLPDAWFEPETGLIRKMSGSNGANSCTDCDIVDWPAAERDGYRFTPYNTVVNAISRRAYADMAEIATALGRTADAATYSARAAAIAAAVNDRLWDATKGTYRDGLMADLTPVDHWAVQAGIFATASGIADTSRAAGVAEYLATRGTACSVYCAAFMFDALYAGDRGDLAHSLLTGSGTRSYQNMIDAGAGATMEAWDVTLKPNTTYSHPWAASPAWLLPSGMFGIRPTTPGYATFDVRPRPGPVTSARVSVPTVKGEVAAAFRTVPAGAAGASGPDGAAGSTRTDVAVRVPGNSLARVFVPAGPVTTTTVHLDGRAVAATADGGYLRVDGVPPGCHLLSTSVAARPWTA